MSTLKDAAMVAKTTLPIKGAKFEMNDHGVVSNSNSLSMTSTTGYFDKFSTGDCVRTWPTVSPYIYTQPNYFPPIQYVPVQGDAVNITTIKTMDGYKGQITLNVGSKNIIVWESKHAHDPKDYAVEQTNEHPASTGDQEAMRAATEAAQSHSETVLRSLFNKKG